MADCAMDRSLLVVFPMADTTTTGLRSTRALTIPATRSMAAADSTEVPPNFITIMGFLRTRLGQAKPPAPAKRIVGSASPAGQTTKNDRLSYKAAPQACPTREDESVVRG